MSLKYFGDWSIMFALSYPGVSGLLLGAFRKV